MVWLSRVQDPHLSRLGLTQAAATRPERPNMQLTSLRGALQVGMCAHVDDRLSEHQEDDMSTPCSACTLCCRRG